MSAATEILQNTRERNKVVFDKTHRLRPRKVEEGDWVLLYDSSLDHQHSSLHKFSKRWFGPYVMWKTYDNGTYRLKELDGTMLKNLVAGKRVKIFKKRQDSSPSLIYSYEDEVRKNGITGTEIEDEGEDGTSVDSSVTMLHVNACRLEHMIRRGRNKCVYKRKLRVFWPHREGCADLEGVKCREVKHFVQEKI